MSVLEDAHHLKYMNLALDLAAKGRGYTAPNPMVGCVIVKNSKIIGSGYHKKAGSPHAEVNAILDAITKEPSELKGATCYVTLEPCCHVGRTGPCAVELVKHQFKTVVIAMMDPNPLVAGKGIEMLKQAGVEVILGVGEEQARTLNNGFISRITKNRPFVRSKIAASLDGAIALHNGQSKWITNELARKEVHQLRLYSDAIVTTAVTINTDDPELTVRIPPCDEYDYVQHPLRVVIDKHLSTCSTAKVYQQDVGKAILITSSIALNSSENAAKIHDFTNKGVKIHDVPLDQNNLSVSHIWQLLAALDCNDVLVEAGAGFNGYLLSRETLVDEWIVYQSGLVMGTTAKGMFDIPDPEYGNSMTNLFKLKCKHIKQIADNWCIILGSNE